ncbi:MAG: NAD(P)-dependent glycerol-3-phosphate dehydrogenase [Candidatus Calescibacterium sp.]|nr:NAD(P)-dependent glycerol-3-phosphate dehydrogenase [Candidatus Calescibacterium sp.]MCX7734548.1 NAD(P)-dependent glycerol-3-phosphate dehydrogenase [bacterium]MDW8087628.1 NAD(P)H-dependent glycerol-3-phosphate dehydrogenase [Candidatus Calescibacterium sp.]
MPNDKKIGIVGAGSWGWAIAHIIERKEKGRTIIWARNKEVVHSINQKGVNPKRFSDFPLKIRATDELEEIFSECEIVFIAVPTSAFREVIKSSSKYIQGDHIIISTSKGLERGTFKRMTEIIKEETCCKKVGVISGPNLAAEIINGDPSGAVVASLIREVQEKVYQNLHSPFFRVYMSYDVVGVELGGALKNIYAIAAGISDYLGFKMNTFSLLLSRAASEMVRFGSKLGAKQETFFGLSGIGDLFATASSDLSRNRRFGKLIAKGLSPQDALKEIGEAVEGYPVTKAVYELSEKLKIRMNIVRAIYNILYTKKDIQSAIAELLSAEVREEFPAD